MTAEEGQDVLMWCPDDIQNGRVRWWRKVDSGDSDRLVLNDAVLPGYERRMSFDSTTGTLTIHRAQLKDTGVYWCSVNFESFQVRLIVSGKIVIVNTIKPSLHPTLVCAKRTTVSIPTYLSDDFPPSDLISKRSLSFAIKCLDNESQLVCHVAHCMVVFIVFQDITYSIDTHCLLVVTNICLLCFNVYVEVYIRPIPVHGMTLTT